MSIESLKEQARRHEQKEEWQKSLDLYLQAIGQMDEEEPPDIGLFNRVGDLYTRLETLDGAVTHYEMAIDLYVEAELPNNAIAICKKILRNMPSRASVYLKMGQIRGAQGFLPDARQNFLIYAEMKMQAGEVEEAFRALVEFADLAPEDTAARIVIADQLLAHERNEDAVAQLILAYQKLQAQGKTGEAGDLGDRILELDPDADLTVVAVAPAGASAPDDDLSGFESTALAGFGAVEIGGQDGAEVGAGGFEIGGEIPSGDAEAEEEAELEVGGFEISLDDDDESMDGAGTEEPEEPEEDDSALPGLDVGDDLDLGLGDESSDEGEPLEEVTELPTFGFEDDAEDEEVALPTFGFDGETEVDDAADESTDDEEMALPTFGFDGDSEADDATDESTEDEEVALPTFGFEGDSEEMEDDVAASGVESAEIGADAGAVEASMEEAVADADASTEDEVDEWQPLSEDEVVEEGQSLDGGPAWPGAAVETAEDGTELDDGDLVGRLRARLEREPDDAEGWLALGQGLFVAGESSEAVEAMDQAHRSFASSDDLPRAMQVVRELILHDSENVHQHQRLVEYAFQSNDRTLLLPAYLELAECLNRNGEPVRSQAVFQQVLNIDPKNRRAQEGLGMLEEGTPAREAEAVSSSSDYIDLGSLILDDDAEKTTRWTVTAEAPSGDEDADFAKMLAQFKEKVSENLESDDVKAHYDLGTAYKEMGLTDEAISEFQQALRADPGHLPSYELMGQCFMDAGQNDVAIHSLSRALEAPFEIEDELIGIYYYLGRAHEVAGNLEEAKDFYERVFALDINFIDVTDRLRELR